MLLKNKTINIRYDDSPIIMKSGDTIDSCILKLVGSRVGRFIFTDNILVRVEEPNCTIINCYFKC